MEYCRTIAGQDTVISERQVTSRGCGERARQSWRAKRLIRTVAVAFLSCVAVTRVAALPVLANGVAVGAALQDARLDGLNGPSRLLSAFRGRPLIINVWASWCGPCKEEMASLERLAWRHERRVFAIIGISTDDDRERAKLLLAKTNATISHYIDHELRMENMLGASRLPLTVLIDRNGRVLQKIYGARQWDSADALRLIDETFHDK